MGPVVEAEVVILGWLAGMLRKAPKQAGCDHCTSAGSQPVSGERIVGGRKWRLGGR